MQVEIDEQMLIKCLAVCADDMPKGIDILKTFISAVALGHTAKEIDKLRETIIISKPVTQ